MLDDEGSGAAADNITVLLLLLASSLLMLAEFSDCAPESTAMASLGDASVTAAAALFSNADADVVAAAGGALDAFAPATTGSNGSADRCEDEEVSSRIRAASGSEEVDTGADAGEGVELTALAVTAAARIWRMATAETAGEADDDHELDDDEDDDEDDDADDEEEDDGAYTDGEPHVAAEAAANAAVGDGDCDSDGDAETCDRPLGSCGVDLEDDEDDDDDDDETVAVAAMSLAILRYRLETELGAAMACAEDAEDAEAALRPPVIRALNAADGVDEPIAGDNDGGNDDEADDEDADAASLAKAAVISSGTGGLPADARASPRCWNFELQVLRRKQAMMPAMTEERENV